MENQTYKIAVIDDEIGANKHPEQRCFIRDYSFPDVEYTFCEARDSRTGDFSLEVVAEFVKSQELDAILLDWSFGSRFEFGEEILQKLRREEEINIPIGIISSMGRDPDVREEWEKYESIRYIGIKELITREKYYQGLMELIGGKRK